MNQDEYMNFFLQEAAEQIDHLENNLMTFKEDINEIHEIFRMAHSLKGSAAMMGLNYMSKVAHSMESLLSEIRDKKVNISEQVENALLEGLDRLRCMYDCYANDTTKAAMCGSTCIKCEEQNEKSIENLKDITSTTKLKTYKVKAHISKSAQMKAIKAFLIINNLKEVSTNILEVIPENYENRSDEEFPEVFELMIESMLEEEKILQIVDGVSEIDKVEVIPAVKERSNTDKKVLEENITNIKAEGINENKADEQVANKPSGASPMQNSKKGKPNIRVDMDKLDALMRLISEFVVEKESLNQVGKELKRNFRGNETILKLNDSLQKINYIGSELQETILSTRMIPLEQVFNRFPRMVRDLSMKMGKEIEFVMEGMETEIDRGITEELIDPITHLLRNSVDHGIENKGTVSLIARHSDGKVVIEIKDNGRGIDLERIKNKAIEKGLSTYEQISNMVDKDILNFIFKAGFSTAKEVTDVSGRGVGLDVVRSNIAKLHGTIDIDTKVGRGTTFSIKLPLTLAITQAMLVKENKHIYAIPVMSIIETIRIMKEDVPNIQKMNGVEMYLWRDTVIPVIRFYDVFKIERMEHDKEFLVIVANAEKRIALAVEKLIGTQDIVVKSLGNNLMELMSGISGVSVLGDGSFAEIIDIDSINSKWLLNRKEYVI
jgi:two-component system chemotaxis sensor kinase CheA